MGRFFPDPEDYPANRLFSLDLLRGLDIFLLTLLGPVVRQGWFKAFPPSESVYLFWHHSIRSFEGQGCAPIGWGIWDFGQPLFIFICGAAVPFAIPKRLDAQGRPTEAFWKHVLGRMAMLWGCGMLIRGALSFTFEGQECWLYADTLQTIAVVYAAAAFGSLIPRRWIRLALALALIAVFGVIQATCGDYTQMGNISRIIDERVFGAIGSHGKDFCYVLTTVAWAAMGILGSLVSELLKSSASDWTKAGRIALCGGGSLVFGLVLGIWIPPIRYIYTVSFIFQTFGLSALLLDVLFVLTDILKFRRGCGFFLLFGQCALSAWMLSTFFRCGLQAVASAVIVGMPRLLGTDCLQSFCFNVAYAVIFVMLVSARWRLSRKD